MRNMGLNVVERCASSRRRHTRYWRDWSSDVCSSDLHRALGGPLPPAGSGRASWSRARCPRATSPIAGGAFGTVEANGSHPAQEVGLCFHGVDLVAAGGVLEAADGRDGSTALLGAAAAPHGDCPQPARSEEHTSELQSRQYL